MSDLIAILYDHECQAGMTLRTKRVCSKPYTGNTGLQRLQFANDFAHDKNVAHGHVAFVESDNLNIAIDKVTI